MPKVTVIGHALLIAVAGTAAALAPTSSAPRCSVAHGKFVLDLGWAKAPTYAGVELPDGRFLQLRYPPEHVDTLGPGYERGHVNLSTDALTGVDMNRKVERVFGPPGTYRFVMRDATTTEDGDVHSLQCSVIFAGPDNAHSGA